VAFLPFSERAKQWEPIATGLRRLAGVSDGDLLAPERLASKVGLCLVDAHYALEDFSGADRHHLLVTASDRWSGGVLPCPLPDGNCVCILNPNHPRRRNRITLMEEIVHMHRKHLPTGLREVLPGLRVRSYDAGQEAEAYGVGAAALLPWSSFFHWINRGASIEEIAETYDVTTQLTEYRIKITGATNLYRNRGGPSRMRNR
jgi:IrrE N-terminal-like domain